MASSSGSIPPRNFYKQQTIAVEPDSSESDEDENEDSNNSEHAPSTDEFEQESDYNDQVNASSSDDDEDDPTDGSDDDEDDPTDESQSASADIVMSRDGTVAWSTVVPRPRRAAPENIVTNARLGEPAAGIHPADIKEALQLFITDDMINKIILHTNEKGDGRFPGVWKATDDSEIRAFIGLLLLAGVNHMKNKDAREMWDEESGLLRFKATMSYERFQDLLFCLRFDDFQTREERREADRM